MAAVADPRSGMSLQVTAPFGPGYLLGRACRIELDRPRIMGILNVTPDSFSDGGDHQTLDAAVERARQMVLEGADLIDIGGESTRPGAPAVSVQQELDRILPVFDALKDAVAVPLSIDTNKSEVASAAMAHGAAFINDISGLTFDPAMAQVAAETGAGLFVMHTRGRPEVMQKDTGYADLLGEVIEGLCCSMQMALDAGVEADRIAVDPGIGFGKDLAGNLLLLCRLADLGVLNRPVLLGTSRKSFLGKVLGHEDPRLRLSGSLATVALGVIAGASLFRVHDVAPSRDAALTAWAISQAETGDVWQIG